jgi:hypothetical protein
MILRRFAHKLYQRSIGLAPRAKEAYLTHLPILVGVATAFEPKVLIEFGSGTFSTLSFLDNVAFPSLQRIESYENNREWFEQVQKQLPPNAPVNLHYVEGEMYRAVVGANTSLADMIFIDDSPSAETRAPTVVEVAMQCGNLPVVVLHDVDLRKLRLATHKFENRINFEFFNPQTCVMWHGHAKRRQTLNEVKRIIQQNADHVALKDIRSWREIFSRELR